MHLWLLHTLTSATTPMCHLQMASVNDPYVHTASQKQSHRSIQLLLISSANALKRMGGVLLLKKFLAVKTRNWLGYSQRLVMPRPSQKPEHTIKRKVPHCSGKSVSTRCPPIQPIQKMKSKISGCAVANPASGFPLLTLFFLMSSRLIVNHFQSNSPASQF